MEYMSESAQDSSCTILCCECGTSIAPNPTNMCVGCLRSEVDITDGIPKQAVVYFCKKCERYLQPPSMWVTAQLESRELLAVCLKKLKGLNKVQLIDAGFVWTEPHSQRIKVKLTIQKEVMNSAVLQQVFVVEFTVTNFMCDDCHRVEAKDFWRAVVQVRQKVSHKKTFLYLEQLILKHSVHMNTVNIKSINDGLDFYYAQVQGARKLVDFITAAIPCKYQTSKQLMSHDPRSNKYDYKETFSVDIVPICKDQIVCLPKKLSHSLGNINPICLCYRVTQSIHLIDPNTLQVAELSGAIYWRQPFPAVSEPKQLIQFMIMEIDLVQEKDMTRHSCLSNKHVLADVWVAKMSDLGVNDQQFFARTHLGHILHVGDLVLGFDFLNSNVNNSDLDTLKSDKIPDVMLVKKVYNAQKRMRKRKWKLKRIDDPNAPKDTDSVTRDYNEFLEDLEEDPHYRVNVNIYKDEEKTEVEFDDSTDDEGAPQISLQEMLEDLHITEDATGDDGAAMME